MVHETIPKKNKRPHVDMQTLKEAVQRVLLPGRDTAIPAAKIAERVAHEFGVFDAEPVELKRMFGGGTFQKIRQVCKELLEEDGVAVLAGPKGFYVAENIGEVHVYEQNIESRMSGLQRILDATAEVKKNMYEDATLFS
jgi:hypothetical protein